ncbi:uncharacterized protein LOC143192530 isoform X1 [Rhynchophorus ferrugineus]|uniref:uncharacterized protein LOC143192530 isoform X1 n=1 Tax=Rhynchophorus ferrugineus TaxID=354439 RepID=UPI003FCE5DB3
MTLPTALLISNIMNASIAREIHETIGNLTCMDILSCKCPRHTEEPFLVPTNSKCLLPLSDEGSLQYLTSIARTLKSALKPKRVRTYSYFSEMNKVEEITCSQSAEPNNKQELMKCLSVALDTLENIDCRFKKSFINQQSEQLEKLKIFYENRDILDLGSNLTGYWNVTHPKKIAPVGDIPPPKRKQLFVRSPCPCNDCDFEDVVPLM